MPIIQDQEFGEIVVRSHQNSSRISLKIAPDGRLRASTPRNTPLFAVKALLQTSRGKIRSMLAEHMSEHGYSSNRQIGKSHSLIIVNRANRSSVETSGTKIFVYLEPGEELSRLSTQRLIRDHVLKALRKEAKSYLPRRLAYLAEQNGFKYSSVKLTHASSRWGSCSSSGTISLNISLMQLPFNLLDYVLIHELCHTRQMNHSRKFWTDVASIDPDFREHRKLLKQFTPNV
ncbi:hypothetical protein B7Z17_00445 [Candidatus Saccharibacteria bacterium 32-49-10]|nr:MAG: hypothetical protein B7Z17_00445 [Candidatus Saccharibacteria bacterium 32-49-10]